MATGARLAVPIAVSGLVASAAAFALAWHSGVGLCNVTTASGNNTTGLLLQAAAAIAGVNLAVCFRAFRSLRRTRERFWILLAGAATVIVCAAALALIVGVNFRGC
jgi:hypothetical protein